MSDAELGKHCMCGCMYLEAECPNCNKVTDADRIEALTEQLAAARQDAKEAEAYAEELEADRKKTYEALLKVSRIHGEVEANLAKAEWLLTDAAVQLEEGKIKTRRNRAGLIWQFLDEIKGESHDPTT